MLRYSGSGNPHRDQIRPRPVPQPRPCLCHHPLGDFRRSLHRRVLHLLHPQIQTRSGCRSFLRVIVPEEEKVDDDDDGEKTNRWNILFSVN
jgi:hypothetical protein